MYLYIMGSGRSGSTILDILLGNSSQIESVGELAFALSRANQENCSCGRSLSDCEFWLRVRRAFEAKGMKWSDTSKLLDRGLGGLWRVWRAGRTNTAMIHRADTARALADAITHTAVKPHLLDSGKGPTHALLLLKYLPESRVVHLVRDPREVLQSFVWRVQTGSNLNSRQLLAAKVSGPMFLAWTAMKWTIANTICDRIAKSYPNRVLLIRFEDLCTQPEAELEKIARAFNLDAAELVALGSRAARQEPLEVGHNISGNHLRHAGIVRLGRGGGRRDIKMPSWLQRVVRAICGPLMLRYGYDKSETLT